MPPISNLKSPSMIITMPLTLEQNRRLFLALPSFIAHPQKIYSSSFWQCSEHTSLACFALHTQAPGLGSLIALHITCLPLKSPIFPPASIIHLSSHSTGDVFNKIFFYLSWLTLSLKVFTLTTVLKLSSYWCPEFILWRVAISTGNLFNTVFTFLHIKGQRQPAWVDLNFLLIFQESQKTKSICATRA